MAIEAPLGEDPNRPWFIGEDKEIDFEILADDGLAIDDPAKSPDDVATWIVVFSLRKLDTSSVPIIEKRTGSGVSVVGIYSSSRAANTQRIRVAIEDIDTDALKALTYRYGLKRLVAGGDSVLSFGNAMLQKASVPAE